VLNFPQEILEDRTPARPRSPRLGRAARPLQAKLIVIERNALGLIKALRNTALTEKDRGLFACVVHRIEQSLAQIKTMVS
jgi:hypothetical protein